DCQCTPSVYSFVDIDLNTAPANQVTLRTPGAAPATISNIAEAGTGFRSDEHVPDHSFEGRTLLDHHLACSHNDLPATRAVAIHSDPAQNLQKISLEGKGVRSVSVWPPTLLL